MFYKYRLYFLTGFIVLTILGFALLSRLNTNSNTSITKELSSISNLPKQSGDVSAQLNGTKFNGKPSSLYYKDGNKQQDINQRPFLQLNVLDTQNTNLLITVLGFEEKTGLVGGQVNVSLSYADPTKGTAAYSSDITNEGSSFSFEILKLDKLSNNDFVINAKFSGLLKGYGSSDVKIEDGQIIEAIVSNF